MSSNEALTEEQEAITSIYDSKILTFPSSSLPSATASTTAILNLPTTAYSFTLTFPAIYPDAPPSILGTHHVDASAKKGEGETATNVLRDVLGIVYTPGQVCLFDLIEEAIPLLNEHHERTNGAPQDHEEYPSRSEQFSEEESLNFDVSDELTGPPATTPNHPLTPPPPWTTSAPLTVSKSTFIARCRPATTLPSATTSLTHLLSTNKKVASATHNITAWRIKQINSDGHEIVVQDSDDDGETAAGGRLLQLMQLMDVWNVVVVVTRWYGGVKLGADRFRCINSVAREVLVEGGFAKGEKEKEGGKSGGGKKGRK